MMNDTKLYAPGTVIFREGDPGDCMYEMQTGCVGVYCDYGGPNQKEVAKLYGERHSEKWDFWIMRPVRPRWLSWRRIPC